MPTSTQAKKHKATRRTSRRADPEYADGTGQRKAGATPVAAAKSQLGTCGLNPLSLRFQPLTGMDMIIRTSSGYKIAHEYGQIEFMEKFIGTFPQANTLISPRTPLRHIIEQSMNKHIKAVPGATVILREDEYMLNIERHCGSDGAWHLPLHWLPLLKEISPALYELMFWGLVWLQQKGVNPLRYLCKGDHFYDEGLNDIKQPGEVWGKEDTEFGSGASAKNYRERWKTARALYATGPAAQLGKRMFVNASRKPWIHAYDIWFAASPNRHNGFEQSFYHLLRKLRVLFDYKDHMHDYYLLSKDEREAMQMDGEDWCTPMDMFWYSWNDSENDIMSEVLNESLNERYGNYGSIQPSVISEVKLGQPLPDMNKQPLPDLIHKFFQEAYNLQDTWFEYDPVAIKTTLKHKLSFNYGKLINIL